jgi:hypothetical protein
MKGVPQTWTGPIRQGGSGEDPSAPDLRELAVCPSAVLIEGHQTKHRLFDLSVFRSLTVLFNQFWGYYHHRR